MPRGSDWIGGLTQEELGLSTKTPQALAAAEQQQQQGGHAAQVGNKAVSAPVWLKDSDDAGDDPRGLSLEVLRHQTHVG